MENPTTPPKDLDDQSTELWWRAKFGLQELGSWDDDDAPLLDSYARALQASRKAARVVTKEGPFARGLEGELIEHPALEIERNEGRAALDYATTLLITPAAREQYRRDNEGEIDD